MRLSTAIDRYLTHCQARDLAPDTLRGYIHELRRFLAYAGDRRVKELDPATIDAYAVWLREYVSPRTGRPLKDLSIKKGVVTVQGFFTFLVQRRYVAANPVQVTIAATDDEENARTIPLADLVATFRYINQMHHNRERNLFIAIALADIGARRSDIARLRMQDVDTGHRQVHLRRKWHRRQVLPVSDRFIWSYNRWLAVRPETDHDYVLVSTTDLAYPPLQPQAISQMFRRATEHACGRAYGPHSVRHTWLSEALNRAGVAPTVAQIVAGHSHIQTTIGYVAPDLDAARQAVDAMPLLRHLPDSIVPCQVERDAQNDDENAVTVDVSDWWS